MEKIQNCQVTIEESRRYLLPYVKVLLEDEDNNGSSSSAPNDGRDYSDAGIADESLHCLEECYAAVNILVNQLADSGLINLEQSNLVKLNSEEENVYLLMAANCIAKADFIGQHFLKLAEADSLSNESGPIDDIVGGQSKVVQSCMARLAELSLRVAHLQTTIIPSEMSRTNDENDDEEVITPDLIIDAYCQYQRRCLRSRSKPAISSLAELRQLATSQNCFVSDILEEDRRRQQFEIDINNDDGNAQVEESATTARSQPHAQAVTVLLGEASSLIQPLAAWRDGLIPSQQSDKDIVSLLQQMCEEAMEILDNEAQKLAVTIGAWFRPDQRGITMLEQNGNERQEAADLLSIESSLEEMAFLCQVLSRYSTFSRQTVLRDHSNKESSGSELQNLLTEQSLHYSTFETRLATLQFNQALSLATPQLIELGRPSLKVPSIVEDAHFVCVRAIERAAGTRSERAVWTVGHWVTEVWGVDPGSGMSGESVKGVYQALIEGVGCIGEPPVEQDNQHHAGQGAPSKPENAFAAALLEAVDDGDDHSGRTDHAWTGTNSAPASGGISSALWGTIGGGSKVHSLQTRMDAEMCCHGIVASENSCQALSNLFSDLVDEQLEGDEDNSDAKKTSMLTFARDELASHARSYRNLLKQRVRTLVSDLCGADDLFDCDGKLCLQNLRLFVENEVYNLNAPSFRSMEDEERLEAEILAPIRRSQIFEEVGRDQCDAAVVLQMAEEMSLKSTEIILSVLLKSEGTKEFNDWGALLLSKQVRLLQNTYCGLVLGGDADAVSNTSTILTQFNRVNQAVSILQLEKPSDWLMFAYKIDGGDDTNLTADEIKKVMRLRVDFSEEAITKVCSQISAN